MMEAPPALRPEMRGRHGSFPNDGHVGGAEEEGVGCKAAVEIVSRNSQKGESLGRSRWKRADGLGRSFVRYQ